MVLLRTGDLGREGGELMEMRREEARRADLRGDVLRDCPGEAEAIVGGGAAPELIDDDE